MKSKTYWPNHPQVFIFLFVILFLLCVLMKPDSGSLFSSAVLFFLYGFSQRIRLDDETITAPLYWWGTGEPFWATLKIKDCEMVTDDLRFSMSSIILKDKKSSKRIHLNTMFFKRETIDEILTRLKL